MKQFCLKMFAFAVMLSTTSALAYSEKDAEHVWKSDDHQGLRYVVCLEKSTRSRSANADLVLSLDMAEKSCSAIRSKIADADVEDIRLNILEGGFSPDDGDSDSLVQKPAEEEIVTTATSEKTPTKLADYEAMGDTFVCRFIHDYETVSALVSAGHSDRTAEYFSGAAPDCTLFPKSAPLIWVAEAGRFVEVAYVSSDGVVQGWTLEAPLSNARFRKREDQKSTEAQGGKFTVKTGNAYGCFTEDSLNSIMMQSVNGQLKRMPSENQLIAYPEIANGTCLEISEGTSLEGVRKSDYQYGDHYLVRLQSKNMELWVDGAEVEIP